MRFNSGIKINFNFINELILTIDYFDVIPVLGKLAESQKYKISTHEFTFLELHKELVTHSIASNLNEVNAVFLN